MRERRAGRKQGGHGKDKGDTYQGKGGKDGKKTTACTWKGEEHEEVVKGK